MGGAPDVPTALTRLAALRKACAKPAALQLVVCPLVSVQLEVAALMLAGALMFTVVPSTVMNWPIA